MRLFRVFIPKSIVALIVCDFLLLAACFLIGATIVHADLELYLFYEDGLEAIAFAALSAMLGLYIQDFYTEFRIRSKVLLVQNLLLIIGVVFLAQAVLAYVYPGWVISRWAAMLSCGLILILFPIWRIAYTVVIYKTLGLERVLFLGSHAIGIELAQRLVDRPQIGLVAVGFLNDSTPPGTLLGGVPVLGTISELRRMVSEVKPTRIVVSLAERRQSLPVQQLLDLRFSGIRIEEAATLYESLFGRVSTQQLRPSQLIFSSELGPQPWNMRLQAMYSFAVSIIALIIAAPVMLLVAIAVATTSRGPILYRQRRVGLHGVPFTVLKFRSMAVDAEAKTGAVWATRNDPRVTRVGRFIRRTRLDELPQLINVLRGEMAIVGPRPERPEFVATLSEQIPFYQQRHYVKPGLTGWAQINYKYGDTIEDTIVKLEYDLYYIKNLSPSLDAFILFHTLKIMLFSQSGQ
jgi:exopolysaccharide biosynthesis polyprenyl glycosylphosphotransferase